MNTLMSPVLQRKILEAERVARLGAAQQWRATMRKAANKQPEHLRDKIPAIPPVDNPSQLESFFAQESGWWAAFQRVIEGGEPIAETDGPKNITSAKRAAILMADQWCRYCLMAPATTLDHVLPASRNGTASYRNLVGACADCNTRKADRTPEEAGMLLHLPARLAGKGSGCPWWMSSLPIKVVGPDGTYAVNRSKKGRLNLQVISEGKIVFQTPAKFALTCSPHDPLHQELVTELLRILHNKKPASIPEAFDLDDKP